MLANKDYLMMLAELAPTSPTGEDTHQELNFGELLEPKLRKLFYETYQEVPEQYSKVFNVLNSKKAKETDYNLGAMSAWGEFGSSTAAVSGSTAMPVVDYQTIPAGNEIVYTHKEFASGFMVERKFADDEMYNVIEKMPKDLARAGRYKVESDAAALFNNAFATTARFKDKDGNVTEYLCDASHDLLDKTNSCSNLITTALSDAGIKEALTLGRKQKDEANKLIQLNFDTLIVPPELEFEAYELIKSAQKVGTTDNDINSIQGRLKIVVYDFLTDANNWFIVDSKRHQLNFFWRVKPEFKREEDFDSLVAKYRGYMRYSFGASDWRGIIGSNVV
jgi:phage major head subunit gpT-like protein